MRQNDRPFSRRAAGLAGLAAILTAGARAQIPASRPPGFALVIANSDYDGDGKVNASPDALRDAAERGFVGDLGNTWDDGLLMARTLRSAGFDVTEGFNCDRGMLMGRIATFRARARSADASARVIIYYAGHGIQIGGRNFLVPVRARLLGAEIMTVEDVQRIVPGQCVSVSELLVSAGQPEAPGYSLLMLDACRDNPWEDLFAARAAAEGRTYSERGLGAMSSPSRRVIVSYASASGGVALDGAGVNGPYAAAFSQASRSPGVTLDSILDRVHGQVSATSGARQFPWVSGRFLDGTVL